MSKNEEETSRRKTTTGLAALREVLHHDEGQRISVLEEENARLKKQLQLLQDIQLKYAAVNDIFSFFRKINDPNDSTTTIETLREYRDYIVENCVQIQLPNLTPDAGMCTFCTVGGHHPFLSSVIMACVHYDRAVARHGGDANNVQPQHWQWDETDEPAMRCHQECLTVEHMHVEPKTVRVTRYLNTRAFPFKWVAETIAQGQPDIPDRRGNMWDMPHR